MMTAGDKRMILDFISFYVVLGIVRMKTRCSCIGVSQRTIERWQKYGVEDRRKGSSRNVPKKLTEEENKQIYTVLCSKEYKDMNPHEVFNSLLDKGIYLASERTFYRILKKNNALAHRSESRGGTSKHKPDELTAVRKNQVWMWDITWLKTDVRGIYYYAYVIEDLFDRSIVGWMIFENESDVHAKELFEAVCLKEKAHPKFVHSDNGEPMKGITLVAFYYQLGIIPSFSRPRVSDDNPYIESFFKSVKHICGYPSCFQTIDSARKWFADFIDWYNNSHMHSGLQYVTPAQKRSGQHLAIFAERNKMLTEAKLSHPERWGGRIAKQYIVRAAEVLNPNRESAA